MESLVGALPFIVILGAFYLLLIRPARNKQRAQAALQSQLRVGVQVMLTSGLFGTVAAVEDDVVVIEASPGVTMRWAKPAVARILTPPEPVSGDDGDRSDDTEPTDGIVRDGPTTPDGTTGTESTEQR